MAQEYPVWALQNKSDKTYLHIARIPGLFFSPEAAKNYLRYIRTEDAEEFDVVEVTIQQRFP